MKRHIQRAEVKMFSLLGGGAKKVSLSLAPPPFTLFLRKSKEEDIERKIYMEIIREDALLFREGKSKKKVIGYSKIEKS